MAIDFSASDTQVELQRNARAFACRHLAGVNSCTTMRPLAGLLQDAVCFPLYDGGNMGGRRCRWHDLFRRPGYDPLAAAAGLPSVRTDEVTR
ncbi:MAG: hypothetical protein AB7O21_01430 [Gammaproteobacteria bacterium]